MTIPFTISDYLDATKRMRLERGVAFDILRKTQGDLRSNRGLAEDAHIDEGSVANISWSRALKIAAAAKETATS